ncbi:hypothetical protein GCM10027414_14530 [Humibacter ginsengiterrae]
MIPHFSEHEYREALDELGREIPRARRLRAKYSNPLDIKLDLNFDFLSRILEIIRDWGSGRRAAAARASILEDEALRKRALTNALVERIPELTAAQLQVLLQDAPAADLLALAESSFEIELASVAEA